MNNIIKCLVFVCALGWMYSPVLSDNAQAAEIVSYFDSNEACLGSIGLYTTPKLYTYENGQQIGPGIILPSTLTPEEEASFNEAIATGGVGCNKQEIIDDGVTREVYTMESAGVSDTSYTRSAGNCYANSQECSAGRSAYTDGAPTGCQLEYVGGRQQYCFYRPPRADDDQAPVTMSGSDCYYSQARCDTLEIQNPGDASCEIKQNASAPNGVVFCLVVKAPEDLTDPDYEAALREAEQRAIEAAERERLRLLEVERIRDQNVSDRRAQEESGALVPCNNDCGWDDLIVMINNIISWVIGFAALIVTVMFCIAGFKIITAGGDTAKAKQGRDLMTRSVIGFAIVLLAWLIVSTVINTFVGDEFAEGGGPSIDEFIDQ